MSAFEHCMVQSTRCVIATAVRKIAGSWSDDG